MTIRWAMPADAATILNFIRELAEYEREPDAVKATEADLLRDGWGLAPDGHTPLKPQPPARFRCFIAEASREPGAPEQPAGFAMFFNTYSTWAGHHGLRLEDFYVTPSLRGRGIGKALLAQVCRIAIEEGCPRMDWDVLEWNEPAIAVYEKLGATMMRDWRIMRLHRDALQTLAANASAMPTVDGVLNFGAQG